MPQPGALQAKPSLGANAILFPCGHQRKKRPLRDERDQWLAGEPAAQVLGKWGSLTDGKHSCLQSSSRYSCNDPGISLG
eukprot:scaffold135467_cov46-Prasinocladus_malaysianus.AAC.1